MKKKVLLIAVILSMSFLTQTFAALNKVENVKISSIDQWFILKWDKVYDWLWGQVSDFEILMSRFPVWDFDNYEKIKKASRLPNWFIVRKFWNESFIKNKIYYFSVVAIDSDWTKSAFYSDEVSAQYKWKSSDDIFLDKLNTWFIASEIEIADDKNIIEINSDKKWFNSILKDVKIEDDNTKIEVKNNNEELSIKIEDNWEKENIENLKKAAAKDTTPPEDISNFKTWFERLNWNNYNVNLNWRASKDSYWDLDHYNLYNKNAKKTNWKTEKIKKEITNIDKRMIWGNEYNFKITSVDESENESTWLLASIKLPKYLPQTWLPLVFTFLISIFWAFLFKFRRKFL